MPQYNIRGVQVQFPYEAYEVQKHFMEKVIMALQAGENALMESPTGTGKTLCLLCATLAWREAYLQRRRLALESQDSDVSEVAGQLDKSVTTNPSLEDFTREPPKILYASRTHSQLSQAVRELKNTGYRPKMCVLGSRDQMCINSKVMKHNSNATRSAVCRQMVQRKTCEFYLNLTVEVKTDPRIEDGVMDIEDLVQFGRTRRACPYYLSRENLSKADIIFLPYNYLVDASARIAQNIDIRNSILIFDEAHNLESSCGESTSFEIGHTDLEQCVEEVQICIDITSLPTYQGDYGANDFALLKALLLNFQEQIDRIELPTATQEVTKPGAFIYELFERLRINFQSVEFLYKGLEAAMVTLANDAELLGRKVNHQGALSRFMTALKQVFNPSLFAHENSHMAFSKFYKVHIQREKHPHSSLSQPSKKRLVEKKLSYWCFSPGVAMMDMKDRDNKVRSIILTSGTLSPLGPLASELHIDFNVRLENPHVIQPEQAFVGVITHGPAGCQLNSSFTLRENADYQTDLGNLLVNISRIVPDGLLVFFPSYGVLQGCMQNWHQAKAGQKSIWERIKSFKRPVVESKNKQEFGSIMNEFYKAIEEKGRNGAVLFAVCRGKVSEGLDFADSRARAVVITGLPYPAARDPKVILKKQYLNEMHHKGTPGSTTLSGQEWYKQQAARAVNQAIGRVIRHKNDYGAILLCDERFSSAASISQLPVWVRPFVKVYNQFGEAQGHLTKFFKRMEKAQSLVDLPSQESTEVKITMENESRLPAYDEDDDGLRGIRKQKRNHSMPNFGEEASHEPRAKKRLASLLDALHEYQAERPNGAALPPLPPLPNSVRRHRSAFENPNSSNKPPALPQRPPTDSAVLDGFRSPSPSPSPNSPLLYPTAQKQEARAYIDRVKAVLTPEEYSVFQKLLKDTKTKQLGFEEMLDKMIDLFAKVDARSEAEKEEIMSLKLLAGFAPYVPRKHAGLFERVLADHEAVMKASLAPQNSHAEEPSSKRLRTSEVPLTQADPPLSVFREGNMTEFDKAPMCVICHGSLKTPFISKCNHVCCYECWLRWFEHQETCPICRTKLRMKQLTKLYFV
ncbi:uncharacterized protein VTP21DRAFT_311 [Calcarisporiella thermophila]|uniref:uncharacterized protein n=1 Tax=Calcarisporiella thermophila TaxID=911321 RepID=UPI00374307A3